MAITNSIKCKKIGNTFIVSYKFTLSGSKRENEEKAVWQLLKAIPTKFLKEWAEELKKEEYPQGKHSLCDTTQEGTPEYCCLGIAGKLRGYTDDYLYQATLLSSEEVRDGLTRIPKALTGEDNSNLFFAHLNDDHNFTFSQIALVIEEIIKFKEK